MFKLEFKTDNAAFGQSQADEVARVLEVISWRIQAGDFVGPVKDFNGNTIGHFELTEDE